MEVGEASAILFPFIIGYLVPAMKAELEAVVTVPVLVYSATKQAIKTLVVSLVDR